MRQRRGKWNRLRMREENSTWFQAAMIKEHKGWGLKHRFILSQVRKLEVQNQGISKAMCPLKL